MVLRGSPPLKDLYDSMSVGSSRGDYAQELCLAHVEGAGTGHQYPAREQHFQGSRVHLFVAAEGSFKVLLTFSERRRIEHDGVVLLAGRRVILQQVEGVPFDPF